MVDDPDRATAGGVFSTADAAERAVRYALPLLEQAQTNSEIGESGFLYVVIMDPTRPYGSCDFENAILYEHAIGDRGKWDAAYDRFARDKARVCWRTGLNGQVVRYVQPQLLVSGDSGLWGGVCIDGVTVAVSGANPWFDEAFAATVAWCFKAVVKAGALSRPETPGL